MSNKKGDLKFNYENYEDDFHGDDDHKKDFNMQTSGVHKKKQQEE